MDDYPIAPRSLTAREFRFVLKRSAQLQREEAQAIAESQSAELGSLTTADLERVADAVGVDPYYLERAADELEERGLPFDLEGLVGAPFSIRLEDSLPKELDEAMLRGLVSEIEMAITSRGAARITPRTLLWRTRDSRELMPLEVTLRVRDGSTRIGIEQRLWGLAAVLYGSGVGGVGAGVGFGVGFGVGLGALQSWAFALIFSTLVLAGSFAICRQILSLVRRNRHNKLVDLLDRLCERAGGSETDPCPSEV